MFLESKLFNVANCQEGSSQSLPLLRGIIPKLAPDRHSSPPPNGSLLKDLGAHMSTGYLALLDGKVSPKAVT